METDFKLGDVDFIVATLFGVVGVVFPEDELNVYLGPPKAIALVKSIASQQTDKDGQIIDPDQVDPEDFYGFCQPAGSGITIMPTSDDIVTIPAETPVLDSAFHLLESLIAGADSDAGVDALIGAMDTTRNLDA